MQNRVEVLGKGSSDIVSQDPCKWALLSGGGATSRTRRLERWQPGQQVLVAHLKFCRRERTTVADRYRYKPDEVCLQKRHRSGRQVPHNWERCVLCVREKKFQKPEEGRELEIAGETEGRAARWVEAPQTARGS